MIMRKVLLTLFALVAMNVCAQSDVTPFEKGKVYASAGLSGLDLNYNANKKWNFNIDARMGYLLQDNWMGMLDASYGVYNHDYNQFAVGLGVRYYMQDNGLFGGAGLRYRHKGGVNDVMPNVNLGYTFFISRTVTIEPELYWNISTNKFKDYSDFGFRIGFGIYLFQDQTKN